MDIIAKETKGKSYHTYRYGYDSIGIPSIDYDNDSDKVMKWQDQGETDDHKNSIDLIEEADNLRNTPSIIKFFLDGSRHVYKVDDISYSNQVFPVIAGQVGVGCCSRENREISKELFYSHMVLVLPDKSDPDGWDKGYFASKLQKINQSDELIKLKLQFSAILTYKTSKQASERINLEDLAIAKVQDYMIDCEKMMVEELVRKKRLGQFSYLLKDGSLEYMEKKKNDPRSLQKIKNNYNWVIGVSKSFNPETIKDHTNRFNAGYIADLPVFHRTPVARYKNNYSGDVEFGVWYIRLRDKKNTQTPFDGVVKVEKILMDDEIQHGIDSDTVDLISASIINERTPTCYGTDSRWANHLYPVFLTESFVKSKYINTETFLHLF